MPNQMIALQARNPQIADPSRQTAQFANMMNMARQQEAAQRQAQQTQQTMDIAKAKESREASKDEVENAGKLIDLYTKRAGQTMNAQGYELLLSNMDRDAPDIAAAFRANLPPEQFDRNTLLKMVGSVSDNFRATYGPLETEVVQKPDGTFGVARTGGFGKPGVFELEEYELAPPGAGAPSPRQMPGIIGGYGGGTFNVDGTQATPVEQGANVRPTQGAPTTQRDLLEQGVDSRNIPAGNPLKPISMTGGAQMGGQPNLAGVVEAMMSSGQISQSNLQLMRDAAGPDKDAQLAQILKSNNIQIVPDAQASTRNAVFRPGEDTAPQMQMVQDMGDYRATGRPARGKSPMQSPMPGSAIVPLPRVAAEARAGRETPAEAAAKTTAVGRANTIIETEKKAAEKLPARKQVSTLLGKIRSAYEELDKAKAIPSETRGMAANAMDYFASSSLGREAQKMLGTTSSKYLSEIVNSRKLLATAIKTAAGMSAQEMNSNVELQLMLDALTDPTQGIEAARATLDNLEELFGTPRAAKPATSKKTPTGGLSAETRAKYGL